jgi:hypothetical protein
MKKGSPASAGRLTHLISILRDRRKAVSPLGVGIASA